LNGGDDVKGHASQEDDPHQPERVTIAKFRLAHRAQKSRVGVDLVGSGENLQIPEHVGDHESDKNDAGDRHDDFLPDRRIPKQR
jgi:hypothetical protein